MSSAVRAAPLSKTSGLRSRGLAELERTEHREVHEEAVLRRVGERLLR